MYEISLVHYQDTECWLLVYQGQKENVCQSSQLPHRDTTSNSNLLRWVLLRTNDPSTLIPTQNNKKVFLKKLELYFKENFICKNFPILFQKGPSLSYKTSQGSVLQYLCCLFTQFFTVNPFVKVVYFSSDVLKTLISSYSFNNVVILNVY